MERRKYRIAGNFQRYKFSREHHQTLKTEICMLFIFVPSSMENYTNANNWCNYFPGGRGDFAAVGPLAKMVIFFVPHENFPL